MPVNPNPTTASLMIKYYNKHFLPILARFKIDLSILDHNYDHLYNFMKLFRASRRRILTANKCVEDLVDLNVEEIKAVEDDVDKLISRIERDHKTRKILEESVSNEFFTVADKSTIGLNVNSFFSTTLDKQRALSFLNAPDLPRNLEGVLFEIDADPAVITTKPFANISEHGDFPEELEVLFMLGSIFRLKSVNYCSTDRVWIIKMALCSDDEHDSKDVLIYMKQQLNNGEINLRTLGKVLWAMGKLDLAEQYFNRVLEELLPTDPLIISLYDDLALMASHTHDYMKSVQWYQKLLKRKNASRSDGVMGIKKPSDSVGTFI
ncbi:unnamed protein product [Rotaria sordida]|uniref:Uncharacterized protein n=1 Tax=Rotaria sordida TaxID=392033 RepID=A0A818U493_9BILA|nr:unnamed protein product [Rotaria sordida]